MSISISFNDGIDIDGPFQLASAGGWLLVALLADKSPKCPKLRRLAHKGYVRDTMALADEIEDILETEGLDEDIRTTLTSLLEVMGVGDENEIATIVGDD